MSSRPKLKLDWCSHEAAKYAVEHWHYSKTLPRSPIVKIGVWESGRFIGCILFSRGASPYLLSRYNIQMTEGCELTRIALASHATPVSRMISIAMNMLRKKETGLRLVVSFADANQGHHGGIYQACGWIYTGQTNSKYSYLDKRGHKWHDRLVSETGYVMANGRRTRCPKPSECKAIKEIPKHRYLMPLDDEMRKRIMPLSKPYPKRAGSSTPEQPAIQREDGGSTPTPALFNSPEQKEES